MKIYEYHVRGRSSTGRAIGAKVELWEVGREVANCLKSAWGGVEVVRNLRPATRPRVSVGQEGNPRGGYSESGIDGEVGYSAAEANANQSGSQDRRVRPGSGVSECSHCGRSVPAGVEL